MESVRGLLTPLLEPIVSVLSAIWNGEEGKLRGDRDTMEASDSGGRTEGESIREELDCTRRLPDDLVVKFMSGFTLKEAARTSILSRRWRNLWKSADFLVLDFDAMKEVIDLEGSSTFLDNTICEKRRRYMKWVNEVVTQLQQPDTSAASQLRKFILAFNLTNDCNSEGDIDRWLLFAISKRVESLDLAFDTNHVKHREAYVFSEDCFKHMKTPVGLSDIRFLRSFRLLKVDVRDEILEHVIGSCPSLEELAVRSSHSLTQLRVVGSSYSPLPLKHLEVRGCQGIKFIEVDHTPHLVRFIYGDCRRVEDIRVGNCPRLVNLALTGTSLFRSFSWCANQLALLYLKISPPLFRIPDVAEHACLEQLTVEVSGSGTILGLVSLLNKCPHLHTLEVNFHFTTPDGITRTARDLVKIRQESIKMVKIVGFSGFESEVQFIEYMMDYFVSLERVVIDRSSPDFVLHNDSILIPKEEARLSKEEWLMAEKATSGFRSRAAPTCEFIVI